MDSPDLDDDRFEAEEVDFEAIEEQCNDGLQGQSASQADWVSGTSGNNGGRGEALKIAAEQKGISPCTTMQGTSSIKAGGKDGGSLLLLSILLPSKDKPQ